MRTISKKLNELGIVSGTSISDKFEELYDDILDLKINDASDFIAELWQRYEPTNPSLNGNVFESLLATLFYRLSLKPIYVQAKLAFVPNVDFDFVLYSKEYGPIILSAKTSLRERYKQADLEGMMVRQVHRKAKSFLITLNEKEANSVNAKVEDGKVLGIDEVVVATNDSFDNLISFLKSLTLIEPQKIDILSSARKIS